MRTRLPLLALVLAMLVGAAFTNYALGGGPHISGGSGGGITSVSTSAPLTGTGLPASPVSCTTATSNVGGCLTAAAQDIGGVKNFANGITVAPIADDQIASLSDTSFTFTSHCTGATCDATHPAFKFKLSDPLDNTDPAWSLVDSNGASLLSIDQLGVLYTSYLANPGTTEVGWAAGGTGSPVILYSDLDFSIAQFLPAFVLTTNYSSANPSRVLLGIQSSSNQTVPAATYAWTVQNDGSMCINGVAGGVFGTCTDKITAGTASASLLASVFIGQVTTATTNYGGDVLPAYPFTVNQVTLRTSAAGSGGSTNFIFRISDGTNTCDCTMACNAVSGNKALTCGGTAGTGCSFAASASLTYSVQSIGDCTVGPTVIGNAQVRGSWK